MSFYSGLQLINYPGNKVYDSAALLSLDNQFQHFIVLIPTFVDKSFTSYSSKIPTN